MNRTEISKTEQVLSCAQATLQPPADHRLVLLDFIPVGEGLPKNSRTYFVLGATVCSEPAKAWLSGGMERQWLDPATGLHRSGVTHWAEIPEIKVLESAQESSQTQGQ